MPTQRLSKFLAAAGVASRRKSEELIFEGRVTVNSEMIKVPQTAVDPLNDLITVDGKQVNHQRKLYFLLNKPKGYVCSARPGGHTKCVVNLFSHLPERLFTVGRLDVETIGLLLVTNDGDFANRVIHPRAGIQKEYLLRVTSEISSVHLRRLQAGAVVEGVFVKPVRVQKVRRGTLKVVVREGRKREVRRLAATAGLTVWELQRIRIGNLHLGKQPLGTYCQLTLTECERIFD